MGLARDAVALQRLQPLLKLVSLHEYPGQIRQFLLYFLNVLQNSILKQFGLNSSKFLHLQEPFHHVLPDALFHDSSRVDSLREPAVLLRIVALLCFRDDDHLLANFDVEQILI